MAKTTPLGSQAQTHWLVLFLLAYALLGAVTTTTGHYWGDDWAQYLLHARNILAGRPYGDTGYIFNIDVPSVGPPSYPPGLPLLLTPVLAVFGVNIIALKLECFALLVLSLPLILNVLAREFGRRVAIVSMLLFALHVQVWALRDNIGSEPAYLLATALSLWSLLRDRSSAQSTVLSSVLAGLWLGALAYAAVACRSIGISLVMAILAYGFAQRKPAGWFVGFLLSLASLVWLQTSLIVEPATYGNELKSPTLDLLMGNINGYRIALAEVVRMPFGLSLAAAAVVIALMMLGATNVIIGRRPPVVGPSVGLREYAARIPVSIWYLGAYLGALIFAAIPTQPRYLLPVLPFVIALAAAGAMTLARRLPHRSLVCLVSIATLAVYYTALHASTRPLPSDALATCADCQDLYSFVRTQTPPGTIVAFAKPRAMALLGARSSWKWSPRYSPEEFQRKARAVGVDMLVLGVPGTFLAEEKNPPWLHSMASIRNLPGQIVFRNALFVAIRLGEARGIEAH